MFTLFLQTTLSECYGLTGSALRQCFDRSELGMQADLAIDNLMQGSFFSNPWIYAIVVFIVVVTTLYAFFAHRSSGANEEGDEDAPEEKN